MSYSNRFNQIKWVIIDPKGKEYGKFREKVNADKEKIRLENKFWITGLKVIEIK